MNPDISSDNLITYLLSLGFHPVLEYNGYPGSEKYFRLKDDGTEFWVVYDALHEEYQVGWESRCDLYTVTTMLDEIYTEATVKMLVRGNLPQWLGTDTDMDYVESLEQEFKHD